MAYTVNPFDGGLDLYRVGTNYAQHITVAKSGGDYTSIQSAIDSITDNSVNKPYIIDIYPGVYTEDIVMEDYVSLQGIGNNNDIVIYGTDSCPLVQFDSDNSSSALTNLTLKLEPTITAQCLLDIPNGNKTLERCNFTIDSAADNIAGVLVNQTDGIVLSIICSFNYTMSSTAANSRTHFLINLGGSASYFIIRPNFNFTCATQTGSLFVFINEADTATAQSHIVGGYIKAEFTHASFSGIVGIMYLHGTSEDKYLANNKITVTSAGAGYAYGIIMDTTAGGGVIHTQTNNIEISGFALNYGVSAGAGDTINLHGDTLTAANGVTGAGTVNYVQSLANGDLSISGDLDVGGEIDVDTINEFTAANGVVIDGVTLKDGTVTSPGSDRDILINNSGVIGNQAYLNHTVTGAVTELEFANNTRLRFDAGNQYVSMTYAPPVGQGYGTAFGYNLFGSASSGTFNSAFGYVCGNAMAGGSSNYLFGFLAGNNITSGSNNFVFGINSGNGISTGSQNIIMGSVAGNTAGTIGTGNTLLGRGAGGSAASVINSCLFIGDYAGQYFTGTSAPLCFGKNAGRYIKTGEDNLAIGEDALKSVANATASRNLAIGKEALTAITTGDDNIAIGLGSGKALTTQDENVLIGVNAGVLLTGSGNIFIGYNVGATQTSVSNKLFIDNSNTATPLIEGDFSTDDLKINGNFETTAKKIDKTTRITGATTLDDTHEVVFCNTGSSYTVTFPAGEQGRHFKIVNTGTAGYTLTIDGNGSENIMGALTQSLADGEQLDLHYDTTDGWY